jgi:Putative bacterial sensory transduction regulator
MRLVLLVAVACAFACPAAAQPVFPQQSGAPTPAPATQPGALITALTPGQVVDLFNAASFPSKVTQDDKQNKWVVTNFWGDNLYSGVSFSGTCNNGACNILNIFANFGKSPNVNQAWINAWNQAKCCVRAYFLSDQDQSLIFVYDVPLLTGVSPDYVKTAAQLFKAIVDTSANFKP